MTPGRLLARSLLILSFATAANAGVRMYSGEMVVHMRGSDAAGNFIGVPFGAHCNTRPYHAEHTVMFTYSPNVYTLTIPTLSELYAEVEEEHGQARNELEEVQEEGLQLMEELQRIAREMTKFPVADWEDKQEIAQAFERQQEIR